MFKFLSKSIFYQQRILSPREVPIQTLLKGTSIIMLAPLMLLSLYTIYGKVDLATAIYGVGFIFVFSVLFIYPYIANLSSLTYYVEQLSLNKKSEEPDLTFLNNVEQLSEAISKLHSSWHNRTNQLEALVAESKLLVDSLPDILIMLDEGLNVIRTNSTAKTVFGGRFLKENMERILEDHRINKVVVKVLDDKKGRSLEYSIDEPLKHYYIVRVERFPRYSPTGISIIIAMHDITEQKRTEKLLADFVANASHEIRTPLTSIIGFIETLQTTASEDSEAKEKFLALMEVQAERMSKLVKDLLSLSQIEKNIDNMPEDKINIRRILTEVQAQSEPSLKEKNIVLKVDMAKNLPKMFGDKNQLVQVFNNLVNNSIKYGNEGSTIKIEVKEMLNTLVNERRLREFDKLVAISVTDESEGISAEELPRLVERFYRVSAPKSRKVSGTGLGLSIAKHIIDRHRGVLSIESTIGKGSIFTVYLPVRESKEIL